MLDVAAEEGFESGDARRDLVEARALVVGLDVAGDDFVLPLPGHVFLILDRHDGATTGVWTLPVG